LSSSSRIRLASLLALSLICYWAFFYGLGNYPLWDPDEGRSGEIAKEILSSGNWVTLTHGGNPYYDKPAPYFWLPALGLDLLGMNEFAVRWPSALAAALTVAIVYLWGSISGGSERRGLWAGMVLATSMEFVFLGRLAKVDMVFTFFFTAALLSFLQWEQRGHGKVWIWLFYLFMALAVLTKGPAGLLVPLLIVGIAIGLRKRWDLLRKMDWLRGALIVAVVSGPWYLVAAIRDPQYIWTFLWDHNVARYFITEHGVKHPEPVYFFLPILIGGFLPWTLFLPPVVSDLWKHRREGNREEALFLFIWAATVLIFFPFSRNKLATYTLPLFPPLALLTGDFLQQFHEAGAGRKWMRLWLLSASFFWLLVLLLFPPLSELFLSNRYPEISFFGPPPLLWALFVFLLVFGWILRQTQWAPWIIGLSSLCFVGWFYGAKAAEIAEVKSSQSLAQVVNGAGGKEFRVVSLKGESFAFYLSRKLQVVSGTDVIERMLHENIPTVALVKEKHLRQFELNSPLRIFVWKSVPSAHALVANFPPSPPER